MTKNILVRGVFIKSAFERIYRVSRHNITGQRIPRIDKFIS